MTEVSTPRARLRYGIDESAELLDISERQVWRMVADGRLKAIREGRRVFIPRAELERAAGAT